MSLDHIGIGIDTARYGHHVSFLDSDKRTALPAFLFPESNEGYAKLRNAIEELRKKHPCAIFHVRIDAAGQYAENLLNWLRQLEALQGELGRISIGQPAKNAYYRKAVVSGQKADPTESMACARFAVMERPPESPAKPVEFERLRECVALLESCAKQQTRLTNQLHALLAKAFPELAVLVTNLSAQWVLCLLQKYPTAERIARAQSASLKKIPRMPKKMAAKLHEAAKTSTASSSGPIAEELITLKVREILKEMGHSQQIEKLIEKALKQLPDGPHMKILTIPGIGIQTAAALISKIVSIDQFPMAKHLVGYFGVFPEVYRLSGAEKDGTPKTGTYVRMSSKGSDLVRRLLYLAAQAAARHNPAIKATYARQLADGKNPNVAIGHCMAKLLRQVFGVCKYDREFDPKFEKESQPSSSGLRANALLVTNHQGEA